MPGGLCGPEYTDGSRFDQLPEQQDATIEGASDNARTRADDALPRGDIAPLAATAALELSVPLDNAEPA
jgi:hypothetical protein